MKRQAIRDGTRALGLLVALGALGACGGGGDAPWDYSKPSYDEIVTNSLAMASQYIDSPETIDPATVTLAELEASVTDGYYARAALPTSGSATYNGYMVGELERDGSGLASELSLTANFGTNGMTGSATNFQHETDGAYDGTLSLVSGAIVPAVGVDGFDGYLQGTVNDESANVLLQGAFIGSVDDADSIPEAVGGIADSVGDELGFHGVFIAD